MKWFLAPVVAVAATVLASSASATVYDLTITGEARAPCPSCGWISQYFPEASTEYSPFTATFTFETDLPPFIDPDAIDWANPVSAATFTYAGGTIDFGVPTSSRMNYFDDPDDPSWEGITLSVGDNFSVLGPDPNFFFLVSYAQPGALDGLTPVDLTCPASCGGGHFVLSLDALRRSETVLLRPETFTLTAAAVPEPATWATMILGMAIVGFGMRRRRRALVAGL